MNAKHLNNNDMKLKIYILSFATITVLFFISCSKNTKILESLSNSTFSNEYYDIPFGTFNEKKSTISVFPEEEYSEYAPFDIIYSIRGNPKLRQVTNVDDLIETIEIVDENTLRYILHNGEIGILKRQTEEDIRMKKEEAEKKKKNKIKNDIAKYVFLRVGNEIENPNTSIRELDMQLGEVRKLYGNIIVNNTNYTIDEVTCEYETSYPIEKKEIKQYYIEAQSERKVGAENARIISIKCTALGIN